MEKIKISFNPKQRHIDEIAEWMVEEKKMLITNNGNWSSITYAFQNKNLVIATYKSETVGFYTLSNPDLTISIDVAEIKPKYRRKGIGKLMLEEIIKKFKNKETYGLYLFCAPESSHKIWKKLGFKYFPDNSKNDRFEKNYGRKKIEMYKIIKPYLKPQKLNNEIENEVIEIWNDETCKIENENPTWVWNLKYIKNTKILKKPIVHFGHYKWRIRWRKGNEIYKDCEYQYFDKKNEEFSSMIIKETPNINSHFR
jgi:GNAT superfamily N-acetyltransferase